VRLWLARISKRIKDEGGESEVYRTGSLAESNGSC